MPKFSISIQLTNGFRKSSLACSLRRMTLATKLSTHFSQTPVLQVSVDQPMSQCFLETGVIVEPMLNARRDPLIDVSELSRYVTRHVAIVDSSRGLMQSKDVLYRDLRHCSRAHDPLEAVSLK